MLPLALCATTLCWSAPSFAIPAFARQYGMSCVSCHVAFPKLNDFGKSFQGMGNRMDKLPDGSVIKEPDPFLDLPSTPPVSLRLQSFVQARTAETVGAEAAAAGEGANFDFQTPYLVKLISGAPIGKDLSFYLYGVFAERGENGFVILDDAWVQHRDLFGSGISLQLGQFQVSELMFPRELRTTFQDYLVYRMAGITYDRGLLLGRDLGPFEFSLGFVNGNGNQVSFPLNSPGHQRPDRSFDDSSDKSSYARLGLGIGDLATIGAFGFIGRQRTASGPTGEDAGARFEEKMILGIDLSGNIGQRFSWFGQFLWNRWDGFLDASPERDFAWIGGFFGVDYAPTERWLFSGLLNWTDARDFDGTGTVFEGIDSRVVTLAASYYAARNLKTVLEGGYDLLPPDDDADSVGHETREHYLLIGFDLAI